MRNIGYLMLATLLGSAAFAPARTIAADNVLTAQDSALSSNDQSTIPYPGGGWGGYGYWGYQGTTVAGSYGRALAAVIRAKGDYNLATSAAAVNWSVARRREIENHKLWAVTYFETRDINREYREAANRRERGNPADYVRYAREGTPKPLTNLQLDAVTGQIRWPMLLTSPQFAEQRAFLERIFAARAYRGVLGADDYLAAIRITDQMSVGLADLITTVPPQAYMNARTFLRSLAYEARLPAG
jgi:hypothetical protein